MDATSADMQKSEWDDLVLQVDDFETLSEDERSRLQAMARSLGERGQSRSFILSALRATALVLHDMRSDEENSRELFGREGVQEFIKKNQPPAGVAGGPPADMPVPREWKRLERERLHEHVVDLVRMSRSARGRHEVKKMRNRLLKLDQRELRRVLGADGEELCRQIGTLLRSFSSRI